MFQKIKIFDIENKITNELKKSFALFLYGKHSTMFIWKCSSLSTIVRTIIVQITSHIIII